MADAAATGPRVIVVAERHLSDLLASAGIDWVVQDRQPSIAAMWDALSGGRLDQHSRILVFSDSLADGTSSDESELVQTARAIVAMANAGAHVFVAIWLPDALPRLEARIEAAAVAQKIDPASLRYHRLPVTESARAVLDTVRDVLGGEVPFPDEYPIDVDRPLSHEPFVPSPIWSSAEVSLPLAAPAADDGPPASDEPVDPVDAGEADEADAPDAEATGTDVVEEVDDVVDPVTDAETESVETAESDEHDAPADDAAEAEHDAEPADGEESRGDEPVEHTLIPPGTPQPSDAWTPPINEAPPAESNGSSAGRAGGSFPSSAPVELLARPRVPGQTTITVTSSKGGSGKSTASILLGGSIARASAAAGTPLSVCLVDLDTRDGQVASLIGTFMPTALNIRVQPIWDEETIRRNLVHADGLGVEALLAPIRPRTADTVGPDFYRTVIRSLQRMYDVIILDTSVQYLDPLIAEVALPEADEILFVTTLASTAVQGMARALREITTPLDELGLGIPREKIGIIVNQSVANVGMERDQVLAAGLGVPVVGVIPLATKDVLTATNLNRMDALLRHPLIGPAYYGLAHACLPGRALADWESAEAPEAAPVG